MHTCEKMRVNKANNALALLRKYSVLYEASERVMRTPGDHTLAVTELEIMMFGVLTPKCHGDTERESNLYQC